MSVQVLQGDCRALLATLPAESVQTCVTSPPYYQLRDYRVAGQIGIERTLGEYVEEIVNVFRAVRRVLHSSGTLWLNCGDSYNAYNGGAGPGSTLSKRQTVERPRLASGYGLQNKNLKPKDLMGVPWRLAFALQEDGWYLRSDIIWNKPNPMPESVADRPTKAHEYVFLLTKNERYFYDASAIREPAKAPYTKMPDGWDTGEGAHGSFHRDGREKGARVAYQRGHGRRHDGFNDRWDGMSKDEQQALGANKRDVWTVGAPLMRLRSDLTPEKRAYVVTELLRRGGL